MGIKDPPPISIASAGPERHLYLGCFLEPIIGHNGFSVYVSIFEHELSKPSKITKPHLKATACHFLASAIQSPGSSLLHPIRNPDLGRKVMRQALMGS